MKSLIYPLIELITMSLPVRGAWVEIEIIRPAKGGN